MPAVNWVLAMLAVGAYPSSLRALAEEEQSYAPRVPSIRENLENHYINTVNESDRRFLGPTLVYVTPWNSLGYDIAKRFRCKFDYVSPVWYQLRMTSGVLSLMGRHDVDAGWMQAVREPCPQGGARAKVLPRVLFEVDPSEVVSVLLAPAGMARMLAKEADEQGFGGWVLEGWSYWAALGATTHPELRPHVLRAVHVLSESLRQSNSKELILAVPPLVPAPGRPAQLAADDVAALLPLVAGLSVMTYDYSSPQRPGPNAPLEWVRRNAEALAQVAGRHPSKVLLGLHFYGNEFIFRGKQLAGHEALVGSAFLQRLRDYVGDTTEGLEEVRQSSSSRSSTSTGTSLGTSSSSSTSMAVQWVQQSQEAMFKWKVGSGKAKEQHFMYYPLPESLALRLAVARELGMGVSIWEIGQGLDYFYDLL